jgi:hypothetical protein
MRIDKAAWEPHVRPAGSTEAITLSRAKLSGSGTAETRAKAIANMNGNTQTRFDVNTKGFLIPRGAYGKIDTDFNVNVDAALDMVNTFDFSIQATTEMYSFKVYNKDTRSFYVWTITLKKVSGDCGGVTQMDIRPKRRGSTEPVWTLAPSGKQPQCFGTMCENAQNGCQTCVKGGWLPPNDYVEGGRGYPHAKGCALCGWTMPEKLSKVEETTQDPCKQHVGTLGKASPCTLMQRIAKQEQVVCGQKFNGAPPARVDNLFKAVVVDQTWECSDESSDDESK